MSSLDSEHIGHRDKTYGTHSELSRSMTLSLSPDQYERLFFQPSAGKGELAKRLGNPTLLGLMGFLIPYSCVVLAVLDFQGSSAASLTSFSGTFFFFGGIAMVLAGIFEFVLGNTFPMAVFVVFGSHWCNMGYTYSPLIGIEASYATETGATAIPGALSQAYNAGQGNYSAIMALITFCFFCGSLRTNVPFVIVFFCAIFMFSFFAASSYQLGMNPTAAGVEHALYYFKIGGGFGFVSILMGWYLAVITACASTGVPCPLPIFDLSTKVFAHSDALKNEHAGASMSATREA